MDHTQSCFKKKSLIQHLITVATKPIFIVCSSVRGMKKKVTSFTRKILKKKREIRREKEKKIKLLEILGEVSKIIPTFF